MEHEVEIAAALACDTDMKPQTIVVAAACGLRPGYPSWKQQLYKVIWRKVAVLLTRDQDHCSNLTDEDRSAVSIPSAQKEWDLKGMEPMFGRPEGPVVEEDSTQILYWIGYVRNSNAVAMVNEPSGCVRNLESLRVVAEFVAGFAND